MDRKALFEQALNETNSLSEALKLVKQVDDYLNNIGTNPKPYMRSQIDPQIPQPVLTVAALGKSKRKSGFTSKRWTHDEKMTATHMFNSGESIARVAEVISRTEKSIRNALSMKLIQPTLDPRSISRRAGSLKGHITVGRKLRNYTEAEAVMDQAERRKV
jgi:hypothetical protein